MPFTLQFDTDNATFEDACQWECAHLLAEIASKLRSGRTTGIVQDSNDNTIGSWQLVSDHTKVGESK